METRIGFVRQNGVEVADKPREESHSVICCSYFSTILTIGAAAERTGLSFAGASSAMQLLIELGILTIGAAAERTGLSFAGASSAMQLLIELDAREVTGRRRNRLYVYDRYVSVLNEGTEVEPG